MLARYGLGLLLRSVALAALAAALTLPLLRLLHDAFGLGPLPFVGSMLLALAVGIACLGAGLSGAVTGIFAGRRSGPWRALAAFFGLMWGLGVALWTVPTYAAMVLENATRDAAVQTFSQRDRLLPAAEGATRAFRERRNVLEDEDLRAQAREASQGFVGLGQRSIAQIPALLLLGWGIILAPLLGWLECHLARRLT